MLKNSLKLKNEANTLLERIEIIKILSRYTNEYCFVGSYANNTMVWRDIDICFYLNETNIEKFFNLGCELANLDGVCAMKFNNEVILNPNKPDGFYWGIDIIDKSNGELWKIDIKGVQLDTYIDIKRYTEELITKLDFEIQELIVAVKNKLLIRDSRYNRYRTPHGSSFYIYDLIVNKEIRNINIVLKELKKIGIY